LSLGDIYFGYYYFTSFAALQVGLRIFWTCVNFFYWKNMRRSVADDSLKFGHSLVVGKLWNINFGLIINFQLFFILKYLINTIKIFLIHILTLKSSKKKKPKSIEYKK
jgi:hypothetical protein